VADGGLPLRRLRPGALKGVAAVCFRFCFSLVISYLSVVFDNGLRGIVGKVDPASTLELELPWEHAL
jgi:hypothetical protein